MQRFWSGERGVLGFSELPNNYGPNYGIDDPSYSPGYAVFNQEGYGWTANGLKPGGYGYVTVLHEIGHLFGLDHPWDEGGFYWEGGVKHAEPGFPGATARSAGWPSRRSRSVHQRGSSATSCSSRAASARAGST